MSSLRQILLLGIAALPLAACGADDVASPGEGVIVVPGNGGNGGGNPPPPPPPGDGTPAASCPTGTTDVGVVANRRNCRLPSRITGNLTLPNLAGTVYSFTGRTDVGIDVGGNGNAAGGTAGNLTIDAGVIVMAEAQSSFLVVNRGSTINANGTAARPIIFTSDENVTGTGMTDYTDSQWGGILLLGRAPISNCIGTNIEGGTADCQQLAEGPGANAYYGGDREADSSGTMRYVQIRYTGFSTVPGNELQGLTTGGVGAGTTLEYIQVHNSGDDGIEVFGGRNNMKNIVITGADDDTLDTDFGYKGYIQFLIGIQRDQSARAAGDHMIEADSSTGGTLDFIPRQNTRLANFTFIHRRDAADRRAILLHGGTDYSLLNGLVVSPGFCLDVDQAETVQTTGPDEAGVPVVRSVGFACGRGISDPDSDTFEDVVLSAAANTNNNTNLTSTLTNLLIPGANEGLTPVANLSSISAFFTNTAYVGAVSGPNDTWYQDWTCKASWANFAGSGASCLTVPAATGA
jgi:hypothetical protein